MKVKNKKIDTLYNDKSFSFELPEKYYDFLELIKDKLYLNDELLNYIEITYVDDENLVNIVNDESSYDWALNDETRNWKIQIKIPESMDKMDKEDLNINNSINNNINNSMINNEQNKIFDKNDIKKMEVKIAKKYAEIFKKKMEQQKLLNKR